MNSFLRITVVALVALVLVAPAAAQEKTDPNEITVGVARLTLSMPYASVRVNGEEWEHSYFEDDGQILVLEGMDRTTEYVLHLVPMEEDYRFVDLAIATKDWKLARLDRQTRQWQFKPTVKFQKWKAGEREAWEKAQEAEPAEPEELLPEEPVMPEPKPSKVDTAPVTIEEAPAEEAPAEEAPAEVKPAEEKPAEEKPAEEKPAEEKPAEEKPAEEKPAEEKPAEEKPAEEPAETTP